MKVQLGNRNDFNKTFIFLGTSIIRFPNLLYIKDSDCLIRSFLFSKQSITSTT